MILSEQISEIIFISIIIIIFFVRYHPLSKSAIFSEKLVPDTQISFPHNLCVTACKWMVFWQMWQNCVNICQQLNKSDSFLENIYIFFLKNTY